MGRLAVDRWPYLEQDHRAIKRRIHASQHFRSFWGAWRTIAGYEAIHMIRKGQACWSAVGCEGRSAPSLYCWYVWIGSLIHWSYRAHLPFDSKVATLPSASALNRTPVQKTLKASAPMLSAHNRRRIHSTLFLLVQFSLSRWGAHLAHRRVECLDQLRSNKNLMNSLLIGDSTPRFRPRLVECLRDCTTEKFWLCPAGGIIMLQNEAGTLLESEGSLTCSP